MDRKTEALLEIILQEAHVIDFDFSVWDKSVSLVVVGGLVGENFEGQGPLHSLRFLRVKNLTWETTHGKVFADRPEQHCQWVIMDFAIERNADGVTLSMDGAGSPCPVLKIESSSIEIEEISCRAVDAVNPTWNQPYCPLARPSLMQLYRLQRGTAHLP